MDRTNNIIDVLSVKFDNPSASYLAGGLVEGRVIVTNQSLKDFSELSILLKGKGQVRLSRQRGRTEDKHSKENYVREKFSLLGDGQNLITLEKGKTSIPFQFILPTNLPSSISSDWGSVSYSVGAKMSRPFPKLDIKSDPTPFNVKALVDLNVVPGASQPQQVKKKTGPNSASSRNPSFCQTGFEARISRSGYVPGDIVDFEFEMIKSANRKVNSLKASLHQITKTANKQICETCRRRVAKLKIQVVNRSEWEMWRPGSFRVPTMPPTTTELGGICGIIDVQYFLRFEMSIVSLSSNNLVGELPIIIGTIPLGGYILDNLQPPPVALKLPQFIEKNGDYSRLVPSAPTMNDDDDPVDQLPPTYAEAMATMTGNFNLQPERINGKLSLQDYRGSVSAVR